MPDRIVVFHPQEIKYDYLQMFRTIAGPDRNVQGHNNVWAALAEITANGFDGLIVNSSQQSSELITRAQAEGVKAIAIVTSVLSPREADILEQSLGVKVFNRSQIGPGGFQQQQFEEFIRS